jgi:hypothetical protein
MVVADKALNAMTFDVNEVALPRSLASFGQTDRIVRVVSTADGNQLQVFDAPQPTLHTVEARGTLRETLTRA